MHTLLAPPPPSFQPANLWPSFSPSVSPLFLPGFRFRGLYWWTPQLPVFLQALSFEETETHTHTHTPQSYPPSCCTSSLHTHTHMLPVVVLVWPSPPVCSPTGNEPVRLTSCLSVLSSCVYGDEWTYYSQWRSATPHPPTPHTHPLHCVLFFLLFFMLLSFFWGQ